MNNQFMKNRKIKLTGLLFACIAISACEGDFTSPVGDSSSYSSGSADFSKFVTIGDSLTAGYADGALYLSGQENSYPSVLAKQFATVGGGSFEQPLVSDNLGGLLFGGVANPSFGNRLVLDASTTPPSPGPIAGNPTTEVIGSGLNGSTFNNMGVPGAKSFHLGAPGYGDAAGLAGGTANPYFVRFASSATTTVITDAATQQPSFFVLWIGNNDVLSFATSGGAGIDQVGNFDPSTYGSTDITDPTAFAGVYSGLVGALAANPATKGVLINIPDVSTIPFFTTVPHNPVPLDQATADTLNAAFAAYNGGLAAAQGLSLITAEEVTQRTITFAAGQNAVLILDEDLTDITGVNPALVNMRQATANDLVILPTSTKIGTLANPSDPNTAFGVAVPLADEDVLTAKEVEAINTARIAFNATIKAVADANANLIHIDVAAIMAELNDTGISYGTGFVESTYATGGAFSLDGVHPTARGYAVISNIIIDAINTGFGANIPKVDPGESTTVFFK
jgi:lysophospholipase L1-like esterase